MNPIELSVVILCYRSEEDIIPFSAKVKELCEKLSNNFEIILVGNYIEGSDDKTNEIVTKIAQNDPCFKTVCKPKQGMMGWDMIEGINKTTGEYVCIMDGDGQFPIESIEECFMKIKDSEYDLVKTYREKRHDGFYRSLISKVYNFLFRILFKNLNSKDVNSKPKIIKRSALDKMELTSTDWFIDAEIMLLIRKMNMKFYEFPITFYQIERASFVKISSIIEFMSNMFSYWKKETFGKK